ncbi:thiol-disulfide oxidoreductase DCC family protein [Pseudoalteromonas xiamenensis]|uniref:thiol-disulfide oxidoreductase DCC family protein n=1 Tax=Pseudoalteromonas xiamenensis TaxID=882626 RepID=UPI00355B7C16
MVIFFDGNCPLCVREMNALLEHDSNKSLTLIDLHDAYALSAFPGIDKAKAMSILHGVDNQGRLLLGLDVSVMAWSLVGKHSWLRILRWPVVRFIADIAYLMFAKHRMKLSSIFLKPSCTNRQCDRSSK